MTINEQEVFVNCLPDNVKSYLLELLQLGKSEISDAFKIFAVPTY